MRRLPLSRLISFNPSENPKLASCRKGTDPRCEPLAASGSMTGRAPNASRSLRCTSGTRTTIWNRRSPLKRRAAGRAPGAARRCHGIGNVLHGQPIARDAVPVEFDVEAGEALGLRDTEIRDTADF